MGEAKFLGGQLTGAVMAQPDIRQIEMRSRHG